MTACKNCGRLIARFHWPTGVTNWCHVLDDGQPIGPSCEFNAETRAKYGSTMAEPPLHLQAHPNQTGGITNKMTTTNNAEARTHKFLDRDRDSTIVGELLNFINTGQEEQAARFLKVHSNLSDDRITQVLALINEDPDTSDSALTLDPWAVAVEHRRLGPCPPVPVDDGWLGILLSKEAALHRSREEIADAYEQLLERRWYGRMSNEDRLNCAPTPEGRVSNAAALERIEAVYRDIGDPSYYEPHAWGYLAGVQAALAWALGSEWGMTDT